MAGRSIELLTGVIFALEMTGCQVDFWEKSDKKVTKFEEKSEKSEKYSKKWKIFWQTKHNKFNGVDLLQCSNYLLALTNLSISKLYNTWEFFIIIVLAPFHTRLNLLGLLGFQNIKTQFWRFSLQGTWSQNSFSACILMKRSLFFT